ncbi:formaldehyde dehydrogenase [Fusarium mundagurra]|uniref:Formaldehyde dehydrogenase n=1 Tax=Fusarium mundagurra TaxID=1567541 RepID=A0A8H5YGS9_9HYPO|nr:formaldehyde dehydrogenase [Fusarium mundagurra]
MSLPSTMKAVVFDVQDERDIIIKVHAAGLCGSELHIYRGHQPSDTGFIMGHEFTGTVVQIGSAVKTINIGDKVVAPFTASCCFFCNNGCSARCVESQLFGCETLDGGQAEYVRIPMADGTAVKAPGTISDQALLLMADIFPTGFYGVKSAAELNPSQDIQDATLVVIGCGPVGLCAILAATHFKPRHLFAIDSVDSRLEQARKLGAEPLNFETDRAGLEARIKEVTEGRGADMVVEVVGQSPALRTAFDIVRPFGAISSIGVHNKEIPWTGDDAYTKNIRVQMGRCPVRSVFDEALKLLEQKQDQIGFLFDQIMPLAQAPEGYALFEQRKTQKVVFTL